VSRRLLIRAEKNDDAAERSAHRPPKQKKGREKRSDQVMQTLASAVKRQQVAFASKVTKATRGGAGQSEAQIAGSPRGGRRAITGGNWVSGNKKTSFGRNKANGRGSEDRLPIKRFG